MPYNYLDDYIELIFRGKADPEAKRVRKATIFVCNDTFYTISNLIYDPKNVALASILLGARIVDIQYPGSPEYDLEALRDRVKENGRSEEERTKYWFKMVDPEIDLFIINDIINMMAKFYDKIKLPKPK
jgi:hypothetical protein